MKSPLVSVIVPTLNNEKIFPRFAKSIEIQSYPKKYIEVIISDGGSKDATRVLAKKNEFKVINNPDVLAEPGIAHGMKHAKGEILMVLAVDNIYKNENAFKTIVKVFENAKIYAAFPKHDSDKEDSIYTKYVNTFTDPFNHFLYGYCSNGRTFKKAYKTVIYNSVYDVYDFSTNDIKPIIALAQGFCVRKEFINMRKNSFDDIEPILNLIEDNKQIAYVHSLSIFHHTIRDMGHFFRKQKWATKNALERKDYGINSRRKQLTSIQKIKLYLYLPYSFSIIVPVLYATYKFFIDKERMWLFHPFINFICAVAILNEAIAIKLNLNRNISRS